MQINMLNEDSYLRKGIMGEAREDDIGRSSERISGPKGITAAIQWEAALYQGRRPEDGPFTIDFFTIDFRGIIERRRMLR